MAQYETYSPAAIARAVLRMEPTSRELMITDIAHLLAPSLIRIIDSHNTSSVLFIFSSSRGAAILKAEFGDNTATTAETAWYRNMSANELLPRCYALGSNNYLSFVLMEYLEQARSVDQLVLSGQLSGDEVYSYIRRSLKANTKLFEAHDPQDMPAHVADEFYDRKFHQRLAEAEAFPYLHELMTRPWHGINGRRLPGLPAYLSMIRNQPKLRQYLLEQRFGLIHGDLHCGNILVSGDLLKLVDPNGSQHLPLEYDIGKLLHSVHGRYGYIMADQYQLEPAFGTDYQLSIAPSASYDACFAKLKADITERQFLAGMFAEAMHFATMLPHHASRQSETTALALRCLQVFDELFSNLGITVPIEA